MRLLLEPFKQIKRLSYRLRAELTDLSQLRGFVVFVGNPRSGTTLVRSILDAHPNIAISNEVNVIRRIKAGEDWTLVTGRILANIQAFERRPEWNGYSYAIRKTHCPGDKRIQVLGDKKAAATTYALLEDFSIADRLMAWSPAPLRFLHCVRHPLDVIATKTQRNRLNLEQNIPVYYKLEELAVRLGDQVGAENYQRIHLEELVGDPRRVIQDVVQFLGLSVDEEYLQACQAAVFDRPRQSRQAIEWPPQALAEAQRQALQHEHLKVYLDQGQLSL